VRDKCDGICDVEERIKCYKEWIQRYSNMVVVLFTLRHEFKERNFKAQIEPRIDVGKPDLLVIDKENREGAAIDHKIIMATRREHISKELEKVMKYIKDNVKVVVSRNQDPLEISIKDAAVIGPSKILDDVIENLGYEHTPVPVITYNIKEAEIELINKTKEIHTFNSTPMKNFFPRGTGRRKLTLPNEAYSYKFILEEPPLSYLLFQVYNVMLGIRTNYIEKEIVITYRAVKDHISKIFPKIFTTGGQEAEQLNESRLQRAWKKLKELQVIEDIGGGRMKVKQPQGSPLDYILRKLAKHEISEDRKCIQPSGLGLLKWMKQ